MNNSLNALAQCGDIASVDTALRTLCDEFGSVSHLDIVTLRDAGRRQAFCLLRLNSSKREPDLMAKLGAGWFGEDLFIIVDLKEPVQA